MQTQVLLSLPSGYQSEDNAFHIVVQSKPMPSQGIMATSNAFNEKVEACIAALLREEYPHMKTSSINVIASATANSTAEHAKDRYDDDSQGGLISAQV